MSLNSLNLNEILETELAEIRKNISKKSQYSAPRVENLASTIDHTILKPDATRDAVRKVCAEAREFGFATVCVNTCHIQFVAEQLAGSKSLPIAVIGFPLGAAVTAAKVFETKEAIRLGAREIDMVINIGAMKDKNYSFLLEDISAVVEAAGKTPVKVILETSLLTEDEKMIACLLSKRAKAAFVKTSTGFSGGGATVEDISLMRFVVGSEMGVKASGGVRTYEDAVKFLAAGASRIGASASVAIVTQAKSSAGGY